MPETQSIITGFMCVAANDDVSLSMQGGEVQAVLSTPEGAARLHFMGVHPPNPHLRLMEKKLRLR